MSKDGARYQPVAWWFTKRRLGRELRNLYQAAEELPPQLLALIGKLDGKPDSSLEAKAKGAARRGNRRAARPRCGGVGACFLARIASPTASTFAEGRDNGEQITVWGRLRVSMKTATEYRVMADKCFKWARNTYMDEVRETYFDCPLDTLRAEAEKAVRVLAKELESATIQGP